MLKHESIKSSESQVIVEEVNKQDTVAIAKGLILQAELLEQDANTKREEAYLLAPELKPGRGRPPTPDELKAEKLEDRKAKRRERDKRKAAEAKIEKKESAINAAVEAKINRDSEKLVNV